MKKTVTKPGSSPNSEIIADAETGEHIIERSREMRIGASIVVTELRRTLENEGEVEALKVGRMCLPNADIISDEQIMKIAKREATLRGFSPPGVTYLEEDCATCDKDADGRPTGFVKAGTRRAPCPDCEGDGFSPPMREMKFRKEEATEASS